ncbi:MAG: hypothetical protein QOH55_2072 [Microbacteriaceae bacterium]|jgi:hypothetical protein|nr:hypothetical protein [Microbacteriaceae bacterium]
MPSFRVTLEVEALRPGVAPESVLPAAAAAAAGLTIVEASSLDVVRGSARITVRFTAEDDTTAFGIASQVARKTRSLADVPSWLVTRRVGGQWHPLAPHRSSA